MATAARPLQPIRGAPVQRLILYEVPWTTHERLLDDYAGRQTPRFAFDRGALEIVTTLSSDHEEFKRALELLIDLITGEQEIDAISVGGMTFRRAAVQRGLEPDSSYYIQNASAAASCRSSRCSTRPPDLVIEIDVSRRSLNKLPIYAAFGVPEVWRVRGGIVMVYTLGTDRTGYNEGNPSLALPPLDGPTLTRFLAESKRGGRAAWVRSVRAWASQPS